jgi:hypothetical protein
MHIRKLLFYIVILVFCAIQLGCSTVTKRVSLAGMEATPATAGKSFVTCYFPFSPFSIFPIITLYEKGMNYLAQGPDICRHVFAKTIKATTRDAFLMPQFWKNSIYKDVDLALNKRKLIFKSKR